MLYNVIYIYLELFILFLLRIFKNMLITKTILINMHLLYWSSFQSGSYDNTKYIIALLL